MAYQVLARKWRPKLFGDVVGQGHVTRTLQNAIIKDKLAHAYLFIGTRGVGKTSIARLFAKAIRCENKKSDANPCLTCESCKDIDSGSSMDYSEIDGASNNSVDDVRALIENVQYLPTTGKYKIYVIDEVHMLSVSAFNALLKTLEEPPAHAIFILATTDPHKLLGTVVSRCQRYDFKNVSTESLAEHIQKIALVESIHFSHPEIIKKIAEMGKGSVRDTLSIFDQVLGLTDDNSVTEETLTQALGLASTSVVRELISTILTGEVQKLSDKYNQLIDENIDIKKLCDQISDGFYQIITRLSSQDDLYKQGIVDRASLQDITISELFWIYETLIKDFMWAFSTINPEKVILIILQKVSLRRTLLSGEDLKVTEVSQEGKSLAGTSDVLAPQKLSEKNDKTWNGFLSYLSQTSPATATNLAHGNLLKEVDTSLLPLSIEVAFPQDSSVFKDYIDQKDILSRLKNQLAEYFEVDINKVNFKSVVLSEKEKFDRNFKTKIELEDEVKKNLNEQRRQKILGHPFIKEAEKLFNSKVDKIILND